HARAPSRSKQVDSAENYPVRTGLIEQSAIRQMEMGSVVLRK
ncbi:unnamed protein product, partial [marine sediment metagenome]